LVPTKRCELKFESQKLDLEPLILMLKTRNPHNISFTRQIKYPHNIENDHIGLSIIFINL